MYDIWWVRYFKSERKLADFYSSCLGECYTAGDCVFLIVGLTLTLWYTLNCD